MRSIRECEIPADLPTELLVIDNGSTDHTQEVVERAGLENMPVRHIHEPREGQCHARNRGLAESSGEVILFTDDDVRVPKNWIIGMCKPLVDGEVDGIAGQICLSAETARDWMSPRQRGYLAETVGTTPGAPTRCMVGGNMAFHKRVLDKVPGFDIELGPGKLGFCDDILFSEQATAAGFRLRWGDTAVEHFPDTSRLRPASWIDRSWREGQCLAYIDYHWRHFPDVRRSVSARTWAREFRFVLMRRCGMLPSDYATDSEMDLACHRGYRDYWNRIVGTPRKYTKLGLEKLAVAQQADADAVPVGTRERVACG